MLFHAAVSNLNRAKAVSVLGVCASCSSKPLRAPAGGAFCQMSVYMNSCVDEVLLLTEPQFLELCFSLSGMLFGENTLKSCLSSGLPFFFSSAFPLNQKGLFSWELVQFKFTDLPLVPEPWSYQSLLSRRSLLSRNPHTPFIRTQNTVPFYPSSCSLSFGVSGYRN